MEIWEHPRFFRRAGAQVRWWYRAGMAIVHGEGCAGLGKASNHTHFGAVVYCRTMPFLRGEAGGLCFVVAERLSGCNIPATGVMKARLWREVPAGPFIIDGGEEDGVGLGVAGGHFGRLEPQARQPEIHIRCQDGPSNLVECDAGDTCVINMAKGAKGVMECQSMQCSIVWYLAYMQSTILVGLVVR